MEQSLQTIPVNRIVFNPDNPRTVDQKSEAFKELRASIKAVGVKIPIMVLSDLDGEFLLLAGERRVRACQAEEVDRILAIVHTGMTEEEAFEITFTENINRDDLTCIEQGKAFKTLLERYKGDVKAVASKVNKTEAYVLSAAKIYDCLIPEWVKMMSETHQVWTIAHWLQLARLSPEIQWSLINRLEWNPEGISVAKLTAIVKESQRKLSASDWPLDVPMTVTLNDKQVEMTCAGCCHQTGYQPALFDSTDMKSGKSEFCMLETCYKQKKLLGLKAKIDKLRVKDPGLLLLSNFSTVNEDVWAIFGKVLGCGQWTEADDDSKNPVTGIIVHSYKEDRVGKKIKVILYGSSKETAKKKLAADGNTYVPLKERRKQLQSKRMCKMLALIQDKIEHTDLDWCSDCKPSTLIRLAATFGLSLEYRSDPWADYHRYVDESTDCYDMLWGQIRQTLRGKLHYAGPVTQLPSSYDKVAHEIVDLLKLNWDSMWLEAEAAAPEPKSWKNLNADGSPKK